jgi:2-polyprenyl-3-methyl-5-hydroxy-6-metoxy-1,4-benzoquinol methylase
MKQKEKDEQFAAHMPGMLQYHALMLGDAVRNKLLAKAIKRVVNKDTSFLDIGAGTGVWAIYAATLGAKRVVAVEMEECLIPIIFKHAQENGVADRIEIVHGKSDDVKVRGRFDVIVSELFGGDALGAETIKSFIDVRERFLAPGGVLIPQKLEMFAVPAHIDGIASDLPAGLRLKSDFLQAIKLNYPQNMSVVERDRIKFLAEPTKIAEADFRTVAEPPPLANLTASWSGWPSK